MAWTAPVTAVPGTALTAAMWNSTVRDNLLETEAAKVTQVGQSIGTLGANSLIARTVGSDFIATSQTTSSLTYVNLATVGPTVTLDTGTQALVIMSATLANGTATGMANASYTISGATTFASGWGILSFRSANGADQIRMTGLDFPLNVINAGSNTFQMKYSAPTGGTATFIYRSLIVWPL